MRSAARALGAGAVAAVALATAAPAPATPRLTVDPGSHQGTITTPTTIRLVQAPGEGRMGHVDVYVPKGYRLAPDTNHRIGVTFGTAVAAMRDAAGKLETVSGTVSGARPQDWLNSTCAADRAQHDAVWLLRLRSQPKLNAPVAKWVVPVFVDRATTAPAIDVASYRLQLCPETVLPQKVTAVALDLKPAFRNPLASAEYTWRAVFAQAPSPDKTVAGLNGVVAESTVPVGVQLTVSGKYLRARHQVVLTGRLTTKASQQPLAWSRIKVAVGPKPRFDPVWRLAAGVVRTDASGGFRIRLRAREGTRYYRALAETAPMKTSCSASFDWSQVGATTCASANVGPVRVLSRRVIRVRA